MITENEFSWTARVYYEDTDAGGIVYYANYLKYFERARTEWLRAIGINQNELAREFKVMFVVKSAIVNYHSPSKLDDQLRVTVKIKKIGKASIRIEQECWLNENCLISGVFKLGCVSTDAIRPCSIPIQTVTAIEHFLEWH